ncbi:hypothetical protein WMY93_030752 [Mugilogobius chulae]|uniref:Phosphatidylinositol 5-phosphate 4-kinase type-2 alpha n=1 Tax=Mugilogobius chulae TaxID=88201 RepID=A0AAW0MRJ5_9GOBI
MHNILKKYHQFIVECHGNTLLPQFLGMYRLTVDGDETYMIVTRNVFSHRLSVYKKYDLKGSTVAREASDKEKQPPPSEDAPPRPKSGNVQQRLQTLRIATRFYCAMKHVRDPARSVPDYTTNKATMNFINGWLKSTLDSMIKSKKNSFLETCLDALPHLSVPNHTFSWPHAWMRLMDHQSAVRQSIGPLERGEAERNGGRGETIECRGEREREMEEVQNSGLRSWTDHHVNNSWIPGSTPSQMATEKEVLENPELDEGDLFMAIIDILQHYDAKKKAAHAAKTVKHGAGAEISTVNPEQYSKRFYDFITTILS